MARAIGVTLLLGLLCAEAPAGARETRAKFIRASLAQVEVAYAEADELGIAELFARAPGLTPSQRRRAAAAVVREARATGLDPLLVAGVISTESSFRGRVVSRVGAVGLMQIMPDTGSWFGAKIGVALEGPEDLFDPERNIHIGVRYLAHLLRLFPRIDHALVAYNAGPARAREVLQGPEAERWLQAYPRKVLREQRRFRTEIARR